MNSLVKSPINVGVKEAGISIEQENLLRVFEPFYRADKSRARREGGSGLGLAIVHELVQIHKGKISLQSKPGEGTEVIVSSPCTTK